MDIHSLVFICALGLVNADGNISSWNLANDPQGHSEANPIAAPVAVGYPHYLYYGAATGGLILAHDGLKGLDKDLGLDIGLRDALSLGIILAECSSISTWNWGKDDIGFEVGLSEAEYIITSSIFNIQF